MKKIIRNNRLIAIALFTVFSVSIPAAEAHEPSPVIPVELKYIGKVNNQSVFQLNFYGSKEENEITINIRDEHGNSYYRENIKSQGFTKRFLFNTDELGDETLQFCVFGKNNKAVIFKIERKLRTVDELVVSEL